MSQRSKQLSIHHKEVPSFSPPVPEKNPIKSGSQGLKSPHPSWFCASQVQFLSIFQVCFLSHAICIRQPFEGPSFLNCKRKKKPRNMGSPSSFQASPWEGTSLFALLSCPNTISVLKIKNQNRVRKYCSNKTPHLPQEIQKRRSTQ